MAENLMTVAVQVFAINEKTIVFFDWDFESNSKLGGKKMLTAQEIRERKQVAFRWWLRWKRWNKAAKTWSCAEATMPRWLSEKNHMLLKGKLGGKWAGSSCKRLSLMPCMSKMKYFFNHWIDFRSTDFYVTLHFSFRTKFMSKCKFV